MLNVVRTGLHHAASWSARLVLLALVAAAPWYYGSARWPAQVVIVYASLALAMLTWLAVITAPRMTGKCVRLVYCMLAFMLLIAVQLVPLPPPLASMISAVQRVTSNTLETSSAATSAEWLDLSRYNTLSVLPEQTQASLAVFCAAVAAVWAASILFVSWRWATTLVITIAISGFVNAFLGLVQAVSWNDWTLLSRLSVSSFSTFVSRNSAATYFASVTGAIFALLGIAYRSHKRKRRQEYRVTYPATNWLGRLRNRAEDVFIDLNSVAVVCICAGTFMVVATMATLSRGGTIACTGASLVTLCLSLGTRGGFMRAAVAALVVGGAGIGILAFLELDTGLLDRMDQLNEAAYTGEDGRLFVWGYTLRSLAWYWPLGSGFGTFHFALLPFHDAGPGVWFYHAESLPLEIASDTGIVGLAIAAYALWLILKQLFASETSEKERLLRVAVTFATCAIGFQSLVDFGLILPGVFLPYGALVGAFVGRCRRIEDEQTQRRSLGPKASDARLRAQSELQLNTIHDERSKLIGHTAVAISCLLGSGFGLESLSGFAAAERLEYHLAQQQELVTAEEEVDVEKLKAALRAAESAHAGHPEVELQAGRVEQFLWHVHADSAIPWGPEFNRATRWMWSDPQVLTAALRAPKDSALAPLRAAVEKDRKGVELAQSSFKHFEHAVRACPLDARAVWGLLSADGNWLPATSRSAALRLLSRLAGNNPQVLSNAGVAAVRQGNVEDGLELLKKAISIQPHRLAIVLPAIIEFIGPIDLLGIIPNDPVILAQTCQQLSSMQDQWPRFKRILLENAREQLSSAEPTDVAGWLALSWVAQETGELETRIQLLRRAVAIARNNVAARYELAQALYEAGNTSEAREELERCLKLSPTSEGYQALKRKWSETVDHNP